MVLAEVDGYRERLVTVVARNEDAVLLATFFHGHSFILFLSRILIRTSRALSAPYVTRDAYIPICVSLINECVGFANV